MGGWMDECTGWMRPGRLGKVGWQVVFRRNVPSHMYSTYLEFVLEVGTRYSTYRWRARTNIGTYSTYSTYCLGQCTAPCEWRVHVKGPGGARAAAIASFEGGLRMHAVCASNQAEGAALLSGRV